MADLGITVGTQEKPPTAIEGGYNFRTPADLDRASTTSGPWRGKFPGLYLNQPLHVKPGDVPYLFISDQPEEARDDRLRESAPPGATGVYARAPVPAAAPVRVLIDHTDGTARPLRLLLLYLPAANGTLTVSARGEAAHADSVRAGRDAFVQSRLVRPAERRGVLAGVAVPVVDVVLKPKQTAVMHLVLSASVAGELAALLLEPDAPLPVSRADLDRLPTLHSIVWREEAARLVKFIDAKLQPTRFSRILDSFQHARGIFHRPDRVAPVVYDVAGWNERFSPVRAYSLFESIPGIDPTPGTRDPRNPRAPVASVDNRGKYGGVEELRIRIQRLPPGCHRVALLVLNPYATFGGRHYVTDGRRHGQELWNVPRFASEGGAVSPDFLPLIERGKAALLWKGDVAPGDVLRMWTEPMANTSVYLWYLVVPLPNERPNR